MASIKIYFVALLTSATLISFNYVHAQDSWKAGDPLIVKFGKGDSAFTFQPWAMIRFSLTAQDNELYLNDIGTRIGFKFRQPCTKNFALFAKVELSFHMISTGESISLSPGNSTNENGLIYNASTIAQNQVFGLRQTYIGLDFYKFGQLTIGKQRGSYLDIADRTDISELNSGWASYAYSPEGSDGGLTGTGRANSCITYRNIFVKHIHFAASVQMNVNKQADSLNSNINSAGASAIIDIYKGFDVAVGYHQMFFNSNYFNPDLVYGLSGNPLYLIFGAQYKNKGLLLGINYALQQQGDLTNVNYTDSAGSQVITSVYSGTGLEIVVQYDYKKFRILTGLNQKNPTQDEYKFQSNDFGKSVIFYGLQYRPVKNIALFFEGRTENSYTANGNKLAGLNMLGLRVEL